ncbi:dTMP kinase [Kribbella sp. NPDC058245]|uniref:dTMP kinase n=1 Tax=Kribbella sp. NPDC058245 TaxID=3346399 RepID=UPI0036DFF23D
MKVNKGVVVEISGVDGAGKTSLIDGLTDRLAAQGQPVTRLKLSLFGNPAYNHYLGLVGKPYKEAPELINNFRGGLICLETLRFGQAEVAPALAEGHIVLCDRYIESVQCLMESYGLSTQRFFEVAQLVPAADVWFHLSLDDQQALERRRALGERPGASESRRLELMSDRLVERTTERPCTVLDATRRQDEVANQAMESLLKHLGTLQPGGSNEL